MSSRGSGDQEAASTPVGAIIAMSCTVVLAGCQSNGLGVADGFNLWIGKVLADLFLVVAIPLGLLALLGVFLVGARAYLFVRDGFRKITGNATGAEPKAEPPQ